MNRARDQAVVPGHLDFSKALLAPTTPAPLGVKAADHRERERRFSVHRNNVIVSLIDDLAESFPVTQAIVGTDFFRALARERVRADPPSSPILIRYAHAFPDFIAGFAPAASIPYLADVARIEALHVHAYHAADAAVVGPEDYRSLGADPGRLSRTCVDLHPACRYFSSRFSAHAIWAAHQGLDDMAQADIGGIDTNVAQDVVVTRAGYDILTSVLPAGGVAFLASLRGGHTLSAAMADALASDACADPGTLFSVLIELDLAVSLSDQPE